jgi:Zn-dependent protease
MTSTESLTQRSTAKVTTPTIIEFSLGAIFPAVLIGIITIVQFGVRNGLIVSVFLVLSLVGHELGHISIAKLNGVTVKAIGFCSKGAYNRRERSPDPRIELFITAAGPLASLALAVLWWHVGGLGHWLGNFNLVIALSNLVPLKHSDGRRILQSARQMACNARPALFG